MGHGEEARERGADEAMNITEGISLFHELIRGQLALIKSNFAHDEIKSLLLKLRDLQEAPDSSEDEYLLCDTALKILEWVRFFEKELKEAVLIKERLPLDIKDAKIYALLKIAYNSIEDAEKIGRQKIEAAYGLAKAMLKQVFGDKADSIINPSDSPPLE